MLRYLKKPGFALLFRPRAAVSEYFGPSPVKNMPSLDEGAFEPLYNSKKRLNELLFDNAAIKEPKKHQMDKLKRKKRLYGDNFKAYLDSNLREEVPGIKGKRAVEFKNLADESHPNNYRFNDDVDYNVNSDNAKILRRLRGLNYTEARNQVNSVEFEFLPRCEADHESVHREPYPKARNYVAELKPNEIIIQNLPLDVHINDILEEFSKYGKIKDIELHTDILNLPAFCRVSFEKNEAVLASIQEAHWKLWRDHLIAIRTRQDADYEEGWNRTLCVLNIPAEMNEQKLIEILSEYGRVMHYELEKQVANPTLPTKEELMDYLNENPEYDLNGNQKPLSIKIINHIIDKGLVETYYIPQNSETEEKNPESIREVFESRTQNFMKMRFLPREIYHTAEWSADFQTPAELARSQINASKYGKIFASSKHSSQSQDEYYKPKLSSKAEPPSHISKIFKNPMENHILHPDIRKSVRNAFEEKKMQNKGWCFVTFASTDQAKLVMLRLNRARQGFNLENLLVATLKEDLEPYELDNEWIFGLLKKMKGRYLEYLHELNKKGENLPLAREEALAHSKEYIERLLSKKDIKQTVETLLERELFNDFENTTIGSLSPSENFDRVSTGRQSSLEITKRDMIRLKEAVDGELKAKFEDLKESSRSSDALLTDYISPLSNKHALKDIRQLKADLNKQAERFYTANFSEKDKTAVARYIQQRLMDIVYNPKNELNFDFRADGPEILALLKINPEKFKEIATDDPPKLSALTANPLSTHFATDGSLFASLIKETQRAERLARFVNLLQTLFLGKFDQELKRVFFDQRGVPLDQAEILVKFSRDSKGNEFLSEEEKKRVMDYLSPENEEEKLQILNYEEEKLKFWENLTHEQKMNYVKDVKLALPLDALFEHEVGLPEKIFKPNLNPGQNVQDLVGELNKEADLGVEYINMKDSPQGQVIYKMVKPAYRVNIQKLSGLNWDLLKSKAEGEIKRVDGLSEQKDIENVMRESMDEVRAGGGVCSDKMMRSREMKQAVEELMKITPFSRSEIEAIFKADFRDPEVISDIQKQFTIESLKEMKRELEPDDFIKYNPRRSYSHLRKKNSRYITSKYKKI